MVCGEHFQENWWFPSILIPLNTRYPFETALLVHKVTICPTGWVPTSQRSIRATESRISPDVEENTGVQLRKSQGRDCIQFCLFHFIHSYSLEAPSFAASLLGVADAPFRGVCSLPLPAYLMCSHATLQRYENALQ